MASAENADANDVEIMKRELSKAMTSLILEDKVTSDPEPGKVDKSKLQELYNKYKGIKADGYTAESWTAFAEARTEAETVLANEKATHEKVDKAGRRILKKRLNHSRKRKRSRIQTRHRIQTRALQM